MSDKNKRPGQGGTVKPQAEEEEKFTQSSWIWHEVTSFLSVGGLFDVTEWTPTLSALWILHWVRWEE